MYRRSASIFAPVTELHMTQLGVPNDVTSTWLEWCQNFYINKMLSAEGYQSELHILQCIRLGED